MSSLCYKRAPYRDIGGPYGHLAQLRTFQGNSMFSRHFMASSMSPNSMYGVYSYNQEIALVTLDDHGTVISVNLNPTKYSTTTSRHQNLCRAWLPFPSDSIHYRGTV